MATALATVPEGFKVHRKLERLLKDRGELPKTREISYADAESLAIGTLLIEGYPVRLTGQDSGRGTFSHRHAMIYDQETAEPFVPLNNIRTNAVITDLRDGPVASPDTQARFCVHDSPLSEASVLSYETATRWPTPTCSSCGRHSLAISTMARRSSSISSSPAPR